MIVDGTLCRKASCVVLVEASRVAGEGDEAAGRKAEERRSLPPLSDVCMKCATVDRRSGAAVSGSTTDELPAALRPGRLALRLVRCRQLRMIVKRRAGPLLAPSAYR